MKYYGTEIKIIKENKNFIWFNYGKYKCRVNKALKCAWSDSDTRYLVINGTNYDGIGFDVKDGYAVSNGILNTNQYSCKEGFCLGDEINVDANINDKVEFFFPTMKNILKSKRLFDESLSYAYELGEGFETFLQPNKMNTFNVGFFFEGFFFGGCSSKRYKTFINGVES